MMRASKIYPVLAWRIIQTISFVSMVRCAILCTGTTLYSTRTELSVHSLWRIS
jgi:hypothetical protein